MPTDADLELQLVEQIGLDRLSQRGRPRQSLAVAYVRDLTAEDIVLAVEFPSGLSTMNDLSPLQRVEPKHHALAMALAKGMKQTEAGLAIGYTAVRVNQLTRDPLFKELMDYYVSQAEGRFLDAHERLGMLGLSAAEELQHRLDERAETLTTKEVREIAEMAFDRSTAPSKGLGVKGGAGANAPVQVNISFPAAVQSRDAVATIDLTPNREG